MSYAQHLQFNVKIRLLSISSAATLPSNAYVKLLHATKLLQSITCLFDTSQFSSELQQIGTLYAKFHSTITRPQARQ